MGGWVPPTAPEHRISCLSMVNEWAVDRQKGAGLSCSTWEAQCALAVPPALPGVNFKLLSRSAQCGAGLLPDVPLHWSTSPLECFEKNGIGAACTELCAHVSICAALCTSPCPRPQLHSCTQTTSLTQQEHVMSELELGNGGACALDGTSFETRTSPSFAPLL